jgi:hypothetical protein
MQDGILMPFSVFHHSSYVNYMYNFILCYQFYYASQVNNYFYYRILLWYTGSMKEKIDSYCGLSCEACEFKTKMNCGGCVATSGRPFWYSEGSTCAVAECFKEKQASAGSLSFCGECAGFPCKTLQEYSNDPEHGDTPRGARIERCKKLKKEYL